MRNLISCAGAVLLFSAAYAVAQTPAAQKGPPESAIGANVQAQPQTPIPPTPALQSVHEGMVARTIDSLPAAKQEKAREQRTIEDQKRAATDTPPNPNCLCDNPAAAAQAAK